MTKRIISGILSFAVMLSALTIFADNNADIKNTSSIIAQAYVDDNGQVVSNNMKVYTGDFGLNAFSIKGGKKGWLFDILSSKTDNYLYMDIDDKLLPFQSSRHRRLQVLQNLQLCLRMVRVLLPIY